MKTWQKRLARGTLGLVGLVSAASFLPDRASEPQPDPVPVSVPVPQPETPRPEYERGANIAEDVQRLNASFGYDLTERELMTMVRATYWEASHDPKAKTLEDVRRGLHVPPKIVLERYRFDRCLDEAVVKNPTCGSDNYRSMWDGDKGFTSIVKKKDWDKKKKRNVYQFDAVNDRPFFFTPDSFKDGLNVRTYTGKTRDSEVSQMDPQRLAMAYDAVISVLSGTSDVNTQGALWYKNSDASSQVWNDRPAYSAKSLDCEDIQVMPDCRVERRIERKDPKVTCRVDESYVMDYVGTENSHQFYRPVVGERTETVWDATPNQEYTFENGEFKKRLKLKKYTAPAYETPECN